MEMHPDKGPRGTHGGAEQEEEATASSSTDQKRESTPSPHGTGHRDLGVGLVTLAICALLWWETTRFAEVPAALSQGISASFFPRVLLATIVLLSCVMIWNGWRAEREQIDTPSPRTLVTAAVIVVGVALIPILGMLLMVALIGLVLPISWGERRVTPLVIYTLALPFVIWCVFSQLLQLRFPTGLLGF